MLHVSGSQYAIEKPILVIIGPSGAGKSTLASELSRLGIIDVFPSWTTRLPRKEEQGRSVEHIFTTEAEFSRKEKEGYFLGTVRPFGLPYRYGLPKLPLDKKRSSDNQRVPTILLRAFVLETAAKFFPKMIIYQIESSPKKITERLGTRYQKPSEMGTRLEDVEPEMLEGRTLAHRIFVNNNENQQDVIEQVVKAIKADFGQI